MVVEGRHVAVLASPGMSHLVPVLELAKRLVDHHYFQVTFLAITTDASPAQTQLLAEDNPTLPLDLHVINLPQVDMSSSPSNSSDRLAYIVSETLIGFLPSVLTELAESQPPLRALIVDQFCSEALEIAAVHSIPSYILITSSALFLAMAMYSPTLHAEVDGDYDQVKRVFLPGCKSLWVDDLAPDLVVPQVLPLCNRIPLANGILVNSWDELEPVTLGALRSDPFFVDLPMPPIHSIGPLIRVDITEIPEQVLTFMDGQAWTSVVYVSFDSKGTLSAEQITELALGLEMSGQGFIWAVAPPAGTISSSAATGGFYEAGCDAASFLPDGFLERTRGVGVVMEPGAAPQWPVLSHFSVGGFVTNCAWNSVMENLGVPMVAWPHTAEQTMNARELVEMGVAVRAEAAEDGVVKRCEVERVVRKILKGDEAQRMRMMLGAINRSGLTARVAEGGYLERLVEQWKEEDTLNLIVA